MSLTPEQIYIYQKKKNIKVIKEKEKKNTEKDSDADCCETLNIRTHEKGCCQQHAFHNFSGTLYLF